MALLQGVSSKMPIVKNKVLSSDKRFPFGNSIEQFFKKYHIDETIEYYKFYFCPWGNGTSAEDLQKIDYKEKIIIWMSCDSFVNSQPFNWYQSRNIDAIKELEKICNKNLDKIFIICSWQHDLDKFITVKNLYAVNLVNTIFDKKQQYKRCNKKIFNKKNWITLNNTMMPHRVGLLSYLLSLNLDKFGFITAATWGTFPASYFNFNDQLTINMKDGFDRLLKSEFDRTNIKSLDHDSMLLNYKNNLFSIYKYTTLEIITGSLFFEPTPFYGEKEIQSIYAQNFPIYINTQNAAYTFKNKYGFDIFEDIIDHSYDQIADPTERLISAINLNIHLLDGTTDLEKLWLSCRNRFEKNCDHADNLYFNKNFQCKFDEKEIKKILDQIGIRYIKTKKIKSF